MSLHDLRIKAGIAAIALSLTFALTGCGTDTLSEKAAEKAAEKATGGKVDIDNDGNDVTVKTDEGEFSTSSKLPENFPKEVPLIEGTIQQAASVNQAAGSGFSVMIKPKDSSGDLAAEIRSQMTGAGFRSTADANAGGYQAINFEGPKWNVAVQIYKAEDLLVNYLVTENLN